MNNALPSLILSGVSSSSRALEIKLRLKIPSQSDAPEGYANIVGAFVLVGARGGYPAPGFAPHQVSMAFGAGARHVPGVPAFEVHANGLDPRAFQVLRNMFGRQTGDGAIVETLLVTDLQHSSAPSIIVPVADENNEPDVYPGISRKIPFAVEWEQSEFGKVRRFLIEMRRPVEATTVVEVAEWTKPWGQVLEAGGFGPPVCEADEPGCIVGSITQFDELTLEFVVNRFIASECSWNVLVNMIDAYSHSSFMVSRIIID